MFVHSPFRQRSSPPAELGRRLRRACAGLVLLSSGLTGFFVASCSPGGDDLPDGTVFYGDGPSLSALLAQVETLEGTPAARLAGTARARVEGCSRVLARCAAEEEDCDLVEQLACADAPPADLAAAVANPEAAAGWVLSHALSAGGHMVLRGGRTPDGGVTIDARLPRQEDPGPVGLLLPADEPPRDPVLSSAGTLLHVNVRPDRGLDFDALIPPGTKRERFLRLQAELVVTASLEGTWELAVYMPEAGRRFPATALALDLTRRDLAVTAMERFLEEIMQIWPLRRAPYRIGDGTGACLSNLNVMPELAPCYVATEEALVVGWNAESLERALAGAAEEGTAAGPDDPAATVDAGQVIVHLDRLPEADRRVAEAWNPGWDRPPVTYPWRRLELRGRRTGDGYRVHLDLVAAEAP